MILDKQQTVANIVSEKPGAAIIFKKHHIDFCCKGKVPLEDVCQKKGMDPEELMSEIENSGDKGIINLRYHEWPLGFLCDYIVYNHHSYIREMVPQLIQMAEKVSKVHGHAKPELDEVNVEFQKLASELYAHIQKEEQELFPLIKASENQNNFSAKDWENLVDDLKEEHNEAGNKVHQLAYLTNDYQYPEWACNTFMALYYNLEAFQDDLFHHIHLENNILFPRVLEQLS